MKLVRLQRWSGLWLHSRSRRPILHHYDYSPVGIRLLQFSTHPALRQAPAEIGGSDNVPLSQQAEAPSHRLEDLPSPPVEASLKSPKLAALHARLSLPQQLPLQTLARCLVDASADPDPKFNNYALANLGSKILGYYTSEHLICHYPRIPMAVLFAAMDAYVGSKALSNMTEGWGVEAAAHPGGEVDPGLLQCLRYDAGSPVPAIDPRATMRQKLYTKRTVTSRVMYDDQFGELEDPSTDAPGLGEESNLPAPPQPDAMGRVPTTIESARRTMARALVGSIYLHAGRPAAKRFFKQHVLSRSLDLATLFNFTKPGGDLSRLCAREAFEPPIARLLSETGRLSRSPVFLVGVYSGSEKLGEGAGASLNEARYRAAAAALKGWYLYSPEDVTVPSDIEGGDKDKRWIRNYIDPGEVIV